MTELEFQLFKLYSEYSMQAGIYKRSILQLSSLRELCQEAKLFEDGFEPQHLNMLVHSSGQRLKSISFPMFCELTAKLAEALFPSEYSESPVLAFNILINEYLVPLAKSISTRSSIVTRQDLNLSNNILIIVKSLYSSFRKIYEIYFPWELKGGPIADLNENSLKGLEKLLKQIEIYPLCMNKTRFHALWRDVVIMQDAKYKSFVVDALIPKNQKDLGTMFTLSKFILCFYFLAIYGTREGGETDSYTEKFMGLLERMHSVLSTSLKHINFIPSEEVMNAVRQHEGSSDLTTFDLNPPREDHKIDPSLSSECLPLYNRYITRLRALFYYYASVTRSRGIRRQGFIKFLKDCAILYDFVSVVDADIIYSKLATSNMEFFKFLESLETIAARRFPEEEVRAGVKRLIEEHILKVENNAQSDLSFLELINQPEILEATQVVERSVRNIFRLFAEEHMNFEDFIKFCKAFEIFPDILSKYKLYSVFSSIASNENSELFNPKDETIHLRAFAQAIVVIAGEIWHEKQHDYVEKICYLIYRMSQCQFMAGREDISRKMSKKYPQFMGNAPILSSDFRDIIQAISHE